MTEEVVIIDDEPANIIWLSDFLEDSGFKVSIRTDVNTGIEEISPKKARFAIIDLNVPVFPPLSAQVSEKGELYQQYPGLFVAWTARNIGYRDRQIVIYTVHRDSRVADESKKIGCTYIMKGRPRMLKDEISHIISFDPTKED